MCVFVVCVCVSVCVWCVCVCYPWRTGRRETEGVRRVRVGSEAEGGAGEERKAGGGGESVCEGERRVRRKREDRRE